MLCLAFFTVSSLPAADMFRKMLPGPTAEEKGQFHEIMDAMVSDMFKNYPAEDILRDMIPFYQKHLTEADLEAVTTFYSSPVGQKMLKEMLGMTSEGMRVSFARLQPRLEEVIKKCNLASMTWLRTSKAMAPTARVRHQNPGIIKSSGP
jgi:hypothetical protein